MGGAWACYLFLGLESLDAEQLKKFRKRVTPNQNFEALAVARRLGIGVSINLITDPSWTREQFETARQWATEVPEVVHLTVATPYPGTELFHTDTRPLTSLDYRLYDIQHAVQETALPLREFYEELVKTQEIINRKFMGWRTAVAVSRILAGQLIRGRPTSCGCCLSSRKRTTRSVFMTIIRGRRNTPCGGRGST